MTCRIQEFPLNYTSIMMTLEFCFASSEDCVLLLDPVCKQKFGWSFGIFSLFLTDGENNLGTKRSFVAFSIFLRDPCDILTHRLPVLFP